MDKEVSQATQFSIKAYHDCWRVNKNSTRKLIDYKRGERCLFLEKNQIKVFIRQALLNSLKSKN